MVLPICRNRISLSRQVRSAKAILCSLLGLFSTTPGFGQSSQLAIGLAPGPVRVNMNGETGQEYILEGASDINSPTNWQFLLSLTLTNSVQHWLDSESTLAARRFYRLARLTNSTPPATAQNFRLIDHLGKSRELY